MSSLQTTSLQFIGDGWKYFSDKVCNKLTDRVQAFLKTYTGADLVIVTGPTGVGKSSYIKSITGADVYTASTLESATTTTALVPTVIGGKRYLFLDMPGFNAVDLSDWDIFYRLMTALSIVQPYVQFRGVMYVDDMTHDRVTPAARRILTWLSLFCGQDYMPNVTIVTTMWDGLDKYGIEAKLSRIERWRDGELFRHLASHGASIYHHGLVKESGQYKTLHFQIESERRAHLAQHDIMARYHNPTTLKLQIYLEIAAGLAIHDTQAGRWLKHGRLPTDNDNSDAHDDDDDKTSRNLPTEETSSPDDNRQSQQQQGDQATGNSDDSSSSQPSSKKSSGFWDSWKDLRYEDVKPWVNLLINAGREYMRRERGSFVPEGAEDFPDFFEEYDDDDAFREAPGAAYTFFDESEPEFTSQSPSSCWPL